MFFNNLLILFYYIAIIRDDIDKWLQKMINEIPNLFNDELLNQLINEIPNLCNYELLNQLINEIPNPCNYELLNQLINEIPDLCNYELVIQLIMNLAKSSKIYQNIDQLRCRGKFYFIMGRYIEAFVDLTILLIFEPNDPFALRYRVETCFMMKVYEISFADLDKLLEINVNDKIW